MGLPRSRRRIPKIVIERLLSKIEEDVMVYLGERAVALPGAPLDGITPPSDIYYLYQDICVFWERRHLPRPTSLEDQPYLLMRQLRAVDRAVRRHEANEEAARAALRARSK